MKNQKTETASVVRYCHPGPSLSTLDEKKTEPVLQSGPHIADVLLLIQMLQSLDGIPCFKNDKVLKFWGIMHYDGMPLNIGTFPRIEGRKVIFDGMKPHLPLHQMIELQQNGSGALKKYISEDLKKILQETKDVLTTLVPEQCRTFTAEAKTLSLLGRPLYITTNANGDFLFTGRKFVCGLRYSI